MAKGFIHRRFLDMDQVPASSQLEGRQSREASEHETLAIAPATGPNTFHADHFLPPSPHPSI
jgi:hypothetical protein